jgi:hypothetical protein
VWQTLLNFQIFESPSKWPKTKIGKELFSASKNYGKFKTGRSDEKEQLPPLVKLPHQDRICSRNSTSFWDLKLIQNFKGFNPPGKNLRNSPKLWFANVYTTIILDHHTCIEKIQVSLQWSLWALKRKKGNEILLILMSWIGANDLHHTAGVLHSWLTGRSDEVIRLMLSPRDPTCPPSIKGVKTRHDLPFCYPFPSPRSQNTEHITAAVNPLVSRRPSPFSQSIASPVRSSWSRIWSSRRITVSPSADLATVAASRRWAPLSMRLAAGSLFKSLPNALETPLQP